MSTNTSLNTLDICLFSGSCVWPSKLIEWALRTSYSHVALGLRDPIYIQESLRGDFIIESGEEKRDCVIDKKCEWGVQMQFWEYIRLSYEGSVGVRRLRWIHKPDNLAEKILDAWNKTKGAQYDVDIVDLLRADFGWSLGSKCRGTKEFVCSTFAAYVLCHVGVLPPDVKWDTINPGDFAVNGRIDSLMEIQGNAKFGPVENIK